VNGYGERAGNADLSATIPDLSLKLSVSTIPRERLELLTPVSHHIAELVNIAPNPQQPYVGASVFAHKAGLHTSAIARRSDAYEHVRPELVGNGTRFVVSEMAGRSTLVMKAAELGLDLDSDAMASVLESLKRLEYEGYHFEVADGSLELLLREATGWTQPYFELESYRVIADQVGSLSTEATVKIRVDGERVVATAEGNGPVNALDGAVRKAIGSSHPALADVHLVDYRVRVLDSAKGTASVTRVLIDSTNGDRTWTTIGVSENIIAASWQALSDSIVYGLLHTAGPDVASGSSNGQTTHSQEPTAGASA
jgi:2-isopropylmalate synthase